MSLTNLDLNNLTAIARQVAWGGIDILRAYYRGEINQGNLEIQDSQKGPVTAADLATNHYILEQLESQLGTEKFGYLSEETYTGNQSLTEDFVWIIDPLDGTRDFIDKTGEYAIHLALTHQGYPLLAVVAIPEAEAIYFAIKNQGTYRENRGGNLEKITVSLRKNPEEMSLVASRTHRDQRLQNLLERLPFKECLSVGSVGCKVVTILNQKADVYISLSGTSAPKDWDFAAPELILTEAGGKFTYFDTTPLKYNQGDVKKWGAIMASNGHCHDELCELGVQILAEIDHN
jgi:3'(2'), 5'-bisphosphate nucleotidase